MPFTQMTWQQEKQWEREEHTPKVEAPVKVKPDEAVRIRVSVGPHPNTIEHSIRRSAVFYYEEGRAFNPMTLAKVSFNAPTTEPEYNSEGEVPEERGDRCP
jgi:superoxide reductase